MGIGKEFAAQLAARGYNLILVARNTKALEELAAELACKCRIISCDLSKEAQCMQLAEELKPLDIQILINNAGFGDLDRDCIHIYFLYDDFLFYDDSAASGN